MEKFYEQNLAAVRKARSVGGAEADAYSEIVLNRDFLKSTTGVVLINDFKPEKAAASANKTKDAAEVEMAAKPAATWSRSTLEWCAIHQLGVDKKVAKAAGFRDGELFRLYQAALDNHTASVSAAAGVSVEAGAL